VDLLGKNLFFGKGFLNTCDMKTVSSFDESMLYILM